MLSRPSSRLTTAKVIFCLAKSPYRHLVRRWNWKSACLSALSRGIVILIATLPGGGAGAMGAMSAEACYRALTSGFLGALTQAFRFARPVWAASLIPMALVPVTDGLVLMMHRMRGTQRFGAAAVVSLVFTAASIFLQFVAMKRGLLIVGRNCFSLLQDLKRIPKLLLDLEREGMRMISSGARASARSLLG